MKKIILTACLAILTAGTYAQDADAMKSFMEYATPGDMHEMLGNYNGAWTATTKIWMDPGQPPMESTADVMTDMYMGGRYQKSLYSGSMGGMPFQGESVIGYDNIKKAFTNTWIDNMGTGIMYSEGKWNATSKSIEFKGKASDPMTNSQAAFRQVITFTSNNSYKMEMYNEYGGKEIKSMEIMYTRK